MNDDFDDSLDTRAEIERLLKPCVCEWCGRAASEQNGEEGRVRLVPITPVWCCHKEKHGGYSSKHWKFWRVCKLCFFNDVWLAISVASSMIDRAQPPAGEFLTEFWFVPARTAQGLLSWNYGLTGQPSGRHQPL